MISASVVIPVGPRIDHLNEQLHALACQETALAFEVVVVDNMPEGRDIDVPDDRFRVVHAPERPNIAYRAERWCRSGECKFDSLLRCGRHRFVGVG